MPTTLLSERPERNQIEKNINTETNLTLLADKLDSRYQPVSQSHNIYVILLSRYSVKYIEENNINISSFFFFFFWANKIFQFWNDESMTMRLLLRLKQLTSFTRCRRSLHPPSEILQNLLKTHRSPPLKLLAVDAKFATRPL